MEKVKVALWGFGAMGQGIAKILLRKKGVEIVGVCDIHPRRTGKSILELLGVESETQADIRVSGDIDQVVRRGACDICVIATHSYVKDVFPQICAVLEKGVNVITIAEEMAYPWANAPQLAEKMDEIARKNGVSVMGTGINPGVVMDLLAIFLSGCMSDLESVRCERVNSLSPFGETVMKEQGIGLSKEAFAEGAKDGTIAGHVGFAESIRMISDATGLGVDSFEQQLEPIITNVDRRCANGYAPAGSVAGVRMTGQGKRGGRVIIDMIHPQQIEPQLEGTQTGDYVTLKGTPDIHMSISPEISGGAGTTAICVNCIPHVINAEPGLRTMTDIPVPRALMDDFRKYIHSDKKLVR